MSSLLENIKSQPKSRLVIAAGVLISGIVAATLISSSLAEDSADTADARPSGPPPATVVVADATQMTMAPSTLLPGTVVSIRDAVIAAETSGKIVDVVNVGTQVEAGTTLAQIDNTDASQLVSQRRAELQRLETLAKYHDDYFKRIDEYEHKLGLSAIAIAELRSNRDTAKADLASGQTALRVAKTALERTEIRAPFNGSVVSQSIQTGEYAQTGTSIVRLVDTTNLEVSAQVPASLVQPIAAGTMLEVTGMGKTVLAPVRALVPVGDEINRTMELRVTLQGTDFMVGAPVRVALPTAQPRDVVAIPRDAIIVRSNSQYVFVVDDDNVAHRKDIEIGYADGDMVEVIGEVENNAQVIVRGGERLRDGQNVVYANNAPSQTG